MKKIKRVLIALLVLILATTVVACSRDSVDGSVDEEQDSEVVESTETEMVDSKEADEKLEDIIIGSRMGDTSYEILLLAKEDLEEKGYNLQIESFSDFIIPNQALSEGELEYNFYQHIPFLTEYNESNDTDLTMVGGPIYTQVWGIFSKRINDLEELKQGSTVAIYNDTSNRDICLRVLADVGLIEIDEDVETLMLKDVTENPYELDFIEMDGPAIKSSLEDVDIAVTTSFIIKQVEGNLDTMLTEYADESYGFVIATQEGNEDSKISQLLYEGCTTDAVKEYLTTGDNEGTLKPLF